MVGRQEGLHLAVMVARLVDAVPSHSVANILDGMLRNAVSYQRLSELSCNQELTTRQKSRARSLEAAIRAGAASLGLGVTFTGDPRGFVVKLQFPDGASNTCGNDGWGIG